MDQRQLGTKLTLDALGVRASVATFDERLTIQKAIYLAQAAGGDLGYYFRWYLRGPYSPELSNDAFAIAAELKEFDESERWVLDEEVRKRLAPVKELISVEQAPEQPRWLELLASVHFLVDRRQVRRADTAQVREVLGRFNKTYTDEEVSEALVRLRGDALLPKQPVRQDGC